MAKIVLYDPRDDSPTKGTVNEFFMGDLNQCILQIPPLVYHGLECISEGEAIVVNIPTELYDYAAPDEHRADPHDNDIPYQWGRSDG
jgi:dTDP-4-dehydrorhamnose 3,5-epimerase